MPGGTFEAGAPGWTLSGGPVVASENETSFVMRRLRAIGVKISIDDFGTGHSSLAYLTTLPNDELKVDRSFIQAMSTDPNAETVVRAIVDLARSLRLDVVAEGVETAEDAAALRKIGCATGQGYLFSRPLAAGMVPAWIDEQGYERVLPTDEKIARRARS
jgi:EAL domain-containing protein (putative c-di-GMP-specific phosphodiesterase class I)